MWVRAWCRITVTAKLNMIRIVSENSVAIGRLSTACSWKSWKRPFRGHIIPMFSPGEQEVFLWHQILDSKTQYNIHQQRRTRTENWINRSKNSGKQNSKKTKADNLSIFLWFMQRNCDCELKITCTQTQMAKHTQKQHTKRLKQSRGRRFNFF